MSAVPPPPVDLMRDTSLPALAPALSGASPHAPAPRATVDVRRARTPLLPLLAFGALSALVAGLGSVVTAKPRTFLWYRTLRKPSFTPPDRVFGLVRPVLYGLASASAARVWRARGQRPRTGRALALWGAQLVLNGAWTPIFFGEKRPRLALADLAATFVTAAAYTKEAARVDGRAAILMAPYLGWLAFAGAVNTGVALRNRAR